MTDAPPEGRIFCERHGPVLLIGIDRVAKRNSFTPVMYRQLGNALSRVDDDPGLRVSVLHAAGDHFSAGLDLPTFAEWMQRGEKALDPGDVEPPDVGTAGFRRRQKPMVIAVKGYAYTLALELVLAADVAIAADNCRFAQLEVKRGIMPTGGATVRMVQRAGWGNAMRHLLTGSEFGSDEALRMNLVQQVVPAGQELDAAIRIAEDIAAQAPLAVLAIRANALRAAESDTHGALQDLVARQQVFARSEDAREGMRAFIEKRVPVYTGR
jgi:enoyl-CoA hydratase